jgi:hypothetical protein
MKKRYACEIDCAACAAKVEDAIKKGNTLQTAASKPHGGIALYRDILANVLDISASKGTENSETDKETEQKFNKGERFCLQVGRKVTLTLTLTLTLTVTRLGMQMVQDL